MISFKKIALALAAAMTLGTLSVNTANAATVITVGGVPAVGGTTSASPVEIPVPDTNNVLSANALKIAIDSLAANTTVTAVATNGKILTTIGTLVAPVVSSVGSTSVSYNTGSGFTADIFVFTTNTAGSSVAVTVGGTTTTYYFKGVAGAINTIGLLAPDSAAGGSTQKVTLSAADIFGNAKGGATVSLQVITSAGTATTVYTTDTATTATTVVGTKVVDVLIPANGTTTLVATATTAAAVTGFATPVGVIVKTIAARDLAAELAAEKAARAAEKAASDKAMADAKAASDAAALKAASDLVVANAEIVKLKAEAVTAKAAADKALADAKTVSDKALADAKVGSDKALAELSVQVAALNKALAALKKKYNTKATKHKFAKVA